MTGGAMRSQEELDALYAELVAAHAGLDAEESARLNARLILCLMSEHVSADGFRAALAVAAPGKARVSP